MALPPDAKQDAEQRMLGAVAGVPALGRGPAPKGDYSRHEYHHPAVDLTSFSKDETQRTVHGYRAVRYEIPPGCAAGYMPELNVLCGIADFSTQSEQPVTKHLVVEVTLSDEHGLVD